MDDHLHDSESRNDARRAAGGWWPRRRSAPGHHWGMALLRREVDRSRRHSHPLALVRLPVASARDLERAKGDVAGIVRTVDAVWVEPDAVMVLLPEADRTGAEGFLGRMRATASAFVVLDELRLACFPEDGLTADALHVAVRGGHRPPAPAREPRRAPAQGTAAADGAALLETVD